MLLQVLQIFVFAAMLLSVIAGGRMTYLAHRYYTQGVKINPYRKLSLAKIKKAKLDPENYVFIHLLEKLRKAYVLWLSVFYVMLFLILLSCAIGWGWF